MSEQIQNDNQESSTGMTHQRIALLGVLCAVAVFALVTWDPNAKYSTSEFWESASVEDVYDVPAEILEPGNSNGGVLMWAAAGAQDPKIITLLISRGALISEEDELFGGTPLSAAAVDAKNPAIIDELVRQGADVNKIFGSANKTPLILAAELNENPSIIRSLIKHGALIDYKDGNGRTALDNAKRMENTAAIKVLEEQYSSLE